MINDVLNNDAFGMVSLVESLEMLPHMPTRLGGMGLYEESGIRTTTATIERRQNTLMLLPTSARGTMPTSNTGRPRDIRSVPVPHIPDNDNVMAEDLQDLRAFGSESELDTVAAEISGRLAQIKANHETTWEFHRIGGIKGLILDADGSTTVLDIFDLFGLSQSTVTVDFATANDCKTKTATAIRDIEDALGAKTYTGVHAFVGSDWMDAMMVSADVKAAFDRWQDGQFLRDQQARRAFPYAGVMWEEYRGSLGATPLIAADMAHLFPTGVRGLFKRYNAPGTFSETVNTVGRPLYVKQERMEFDVGVKIHSQSNPLHLCTNPSTLIEMQLA